MPETDWSPPARLVGRFGTVGAVHVSTARVEDASSWAMEPDRTGSELLGSALVSGIVTSLGSPVRSSLIPVDLKFVGSEPGIRSFFVLLSVSGLMMTPIMFVMLRAHIKDELVEHPARGDGRVRGLYAPVSAGRTPFGALGLGASSEVISTGQAVTIVAISIVAISLVSACAFQLCSGCISEAGPSARSARNLRGGAPEVGTSL